MSGDAGFLLEPCRTRSGWQVLPGGRHDDLDLQTVSTRIEAAGWTARLRTRLCHVFNGEPDLTLYPSGRLLIKDDDRDLAEGIAARLVAEWLPEASA